MTLYINDNGAPSTWAVECPFEKSDATQQGLDEFKKEMGTIYTPYCHGLMWSAYDFEMQESEEMYTEFQDQPTEYDPS